MRRVLIVWIIQLVVSVIIMKTFQGSYSLWMFGGNDLPFFKALKVCDKCINPLRSLKAYEFWHLFSNLKTNSSLSENKQLDSFILWSTRIIIFNKWQCFGIWPVKWRVCMRHILWIKGEYVNNLSNFVFEFWEKKLSWKLCEFEMKSL